MCCNVAYVFQLCRSQRYHKIRHLVLEKSSFISKSEFDMSLWWFVKAASSAGHCLYSICER